MTLGLSENFHRYLASLSRFPKQEDVANENVDKPSIHILMDIQ
jgi:hypothetical protein